VDASTGKDGKKGVGLVVGDRKGDIMAACRSFMTNWEVETMDVYAIFYGLRICWQARIRMLELEMDLKLVADALNGRTKLLNYTFIFIHDALTLGA